MDVGGRVTHGAVTELPRCAEAAFSLGYIYETGRGVEPDKDSAANWYFRASQLYLRDWRSDDARAVVAALDGLVLEHPLARELEAKLSLVESFGGPIGDMPTIK